MGSTPVLGQFAHDLAPCEAFECIGAAYPGRVINMLTKAGQFALSPKIVRSGIKECDIVLIGLSSSPQNALVELMAAEGAIELGKPLAIFADNIGVWSRPHFESIRDGVGLVFVATEAEELGARRLFQNAKIVPATNPTWDTFTTKGDRAKVRKQLGVEDELKSMPKGATQRIEHEVVIMVAGTKTRSVNHALIYVATEAVRQTFRQDDVEKKFTLLWSPHPGETKGMEPEQKISHDAEYAQLFVFGGVPFRILPRDMNTHRALQAVNAVLQAGTASTAAIEAAYRNVPVIDAPGFVFAGHIKSQVGDGAFTPGRVGLTHRPVFLEDVPKLLERIACSDLGPTQDALKFAARKPADSAGIIVAKLLELATKKAGV